MAFRIIRRTVPSLLRTHSIRTETCLGRHSFGVVDSSAFPESPLLADRLVPLVMMRAWLLLFAKENSSKQWQEMRSSSSGVLQAGSTRRPEFLGTVAFFVNQRSGAHLRLNVSRFLSAPSSFALLSLRVG